MDKKAGRFSVLKNSKIVQRVSRTFKRRNQTKINDSRVSEGSSALQSSSNNTQTLEESKYNATETQSSDLHENLMSSSNADNNL